MSIEGGISVKINIADGKLSSVLLSSQRPFHTDMLVKKQRPQHAIDLVSSLYQVCSGAQSSAAIQAMEHAKGIKVMNSISAVRLQLVRMETIREHVWRIVLDWPVMIDEKPDKLIMKQMLQIANNWSHAIDVQKQAFVLDSKTIESDLDNANKLLGDCGALLEQVVFAMPIQQWLALEHVSELFVWAEKGQTQAARLLHFLLQKSWANSGQSSAGCLPELSPYEIEKMLAKDSDIFIRKPDLNGATQETTPYSRQLQHPLIQSLKTEFGSGLLVRYCAVLIEVAAIYYEMEKTLNNKMPSPIQPTFTMNTMLKENSGIGIVEAARGRLIHRVEVENGTVADYQIIAPTEWNFHPQGALVQSLSSLTPDDDLEQQAHLLIHAMDPCVAYTLQVHNNA